MLSIVGIIVSIILLGVLCYKRVNIIVSSVICSIVVALTASLPILDSITTAYMNGFGEYISANFIMFALSALFGKILEDSGAAAALAKIICRLLGKFSVYGCMLVTAGLVYGGVSLFVIVFTMFPIFLPVFKEQNLPARFIPGTIFAASCTFACTMLPGTPTLNNLIPTEYLGTTPMAAPMMGIICALVTAALIFLYFNYEFRKAAKRGEGFVANAYLTKALENCKISEEPKTSLGIMALIPMAALIISLNVLQLSTNVALLVGVLVGFVVFWTKIENKLDCIEGGIRSSITSITNVCAVIGFGKVIQTTPGFASIVDAVTGMGGNPLIAVGVSTTLVAGATGSGTGGISITMETLADKFLAMGANPEAIHRVASIATCGLDSLPHNSVVVTSLQTCGSNHKEGYFPIFVTSVVITLIALVVAIVIGGIAY